MTSSTTLVFSMCQACSMLLVLFPFMNEETEASECSLALSRVIALFRGGGRDGLFDAASRGPLLALGDCPSPFPPPLCSLSLVSSVLSSHPQAVPRPAHRRAGGP